MIQPNSQCFECKWFVTNSQKHKCGCKAYPGGIPDAILSNRVDHRHPHPGDNGILFEELDKRGSMDGKAETD